MEEQKYLPLGSIVRLEGNIRKILIISRGIVVNVEEKKTFFEYGGCVYPEGLISDKILYFNNKNIEKVLFKGYKDEDDEVIINNILKWKEKNKDIIDVEKGE